MRHRRNEVYNVADKSTVAVFETLEQAEQAVRRLNEGNYPIEQISIVAQNLETEKEVHGFITAGDIAKQGAGTGAWFGGIFGLLMGGAVLFVPGVGPLVVAGSLAAAMLGAAEGAAVGATAGALLSALAGWGVSREHIIKYEDHIKSGKYLVVAHGSDEQVERARGILGGTSPLELTKHAELTTDKSTDRAVAHAH
jgi:uncharacterized membrane protein